MKVNIITLAPFEAQSLKKVGWSYEGVGWVAPTTGSNVYRVYNPNSGEHLYTSSAFEKILSLKQVGNMKGFLGTLVVNFLFTDYLTLKQLENKKAITIL